IGVGDGSFFEKAFGRLQKMVQRSRILVVAAHQDQMLQQLCKKALWLNRGDLVRFGDFDTVIAAYRNPHLHQSRAPAKPDPVPEICTGR
ncbi:MAG TPA: hypothetical protein VGL89_15945, partial [Candidatus Koribacter sp.]